MGIFLTEKEIGRKGLILTQKKEASFRGLYSI